MFSSQHVKQFHRETVWMQEEVRRIGRARFESVYWPSLDQAIVNSAVYQHSLVICDPNKDNALAGFVLVCPPPDRHKAVQWGLSRIDYSNLYEVAFVAVDAAWEGRGVARQLLARVCDSLVGKGAWLHVDLVNPRAARLYESFGFFVLDTVADPYGSAGYLMVLERAKFGRNAADTQVRPALFYSGPCETEQPFGRGIFAPPHMAGGGHAFPCLV